MAILEIQKVQFGLVFLIPVTRSTELTTQRSCTVVHEQSKDTTMGSEGCKFCRSLCFEGYHLQTTLVIVPLELPVTTNLEHLVEWEGIRGNDLLKVKKVFMGDRTPANYQSNFSIHLVYSLRQHTMALAICICVLATTTFSLKLPKVMI